MEQYGFRIGNVVILKGFSGWVGQVFVFNDEGFVFCGGWKQFVVYYNIGVGDYVVCIFIVDLKFFVKIYNKFGCEKDYFFYVFIFEGFKVYFLIFKFLEGGCEFFLINFGGKCKILDEVKFFFGIGKKLCMQQFGFERLIVEEGNVEIEMKLYIVFEFKFDYDFDL